MNADVDSTTVSFLTLNSFNVNDELASIALNNLAGLLSLVMSTNDLTSAQT